MMRLKELRSKVRSTRRSGKTHKLALEPMEQRMLMTAIVAWDVNGQSGFGTQGFLPQTVDASVTSVEGLTRGAGIGTGGSAAGRAWGGTNWTGGATNYAEFGFTVAAGNTLSITSMNESYRRSNTGPASGTLQYSLNGGAFNQAATMAFTSTSSSGVALPAIDLSGVAGLQGLTAGTVVTFRIVPTGGVSTGTFYVFDQNNSTSPDLTINGDVGFTSTAETFKLDASNLVVNKDAGTVTITVDRSSTGDLSDTASIHYSTADGTALAGTDYTSTSGTLNFASGEAQKTFTIAITNNSPISLNKSFSITLDSPATGDGSRVALLGTPSTETITIHDQRTVDISTHSTPGGNATAQPAGLRAAPNGVKFWNVEGAANAANASWAVADFNNQGSDDHFILPSQIGSINAITLSTVNSPAAFSANGPVNVYVVVDTTTSILSGDPGQALKFDTADPVEGLNGQLGQKYLVGTINFDKTQPASGVYTDFTFNAADIDPTTLAFIQDAINNGQVLRVVVTPESDTVAATWAGDDVFDYGDGNGPQRIAPKLSVNYTPAGTAGEADFSTSDYTANDSDSSVTITVHRVGSTAGAASVDYTTGNGTGVAGIDYSATSGTLNFADGEDTKTFTIMPMNVNADGSKTVNITLSNPQNMTLGSQSSATLTITQHADVTATAPTLVSTQVGNGAAQRSTVGSLSLTFNAAVNFAANSFSVLKYTTDATGTKTGETTDVTSNFTPTSNDGGITWTITLNGGSSLDRTSGGHGLLSDGIYQVVLHGSNITDAATGTASFNSGADQVATFDSAGHTGSSFVAVLYGDGNGNGIVNTTDFGQFRNANGSTTDTVFDFDGNGIVNTTDFGRFRTNNGKLFNY